MKKLLVLGLLIVFGFNLEAQVIEFKDADFKAKLLETSVNLYFAQDQNNNNIKIDSNGDGEIQVAEALVVWKLHINSSKIKSISGIEFFKNLRSLSCDNNELSQIDVSKNTNLEYLYCYQNQLTTLDISKNLKMHTLDCHENKISSLDVSKNSWLSRLVCSYNEIVQLSLSNGDLYDLDCSNNNIIFLDVSKCKNLKYIDCNNNFLKSLNFFSNNTIERVSCFKNQLQTLILENATALNYLNCSNNLISTIDVSSCKKVDFLICNNNPLKLINIRNGIKTNLDTGDLSVLKCINVDENELDDIKQFIQKDKKNLTVRIISKNCSFDYLQFSDSKFEDALVNSAVNINQDCGIDQYEADNVTELQLSSYGLTQLDLSYFKNLKILNCSDNSLSQLDLSANNQLLRLNCSTNNISQLNVITNSQLAEINCSSNKLSALNIKSNSHLYNINCSNNNISQLDISLNSQLEALNCSSNNLSALNFKPSNLLNKLDCSDNKLSFLDLSMIESNSFELNCSNNLLESLNIKNNRATKITSIKNNPNLTYVCVDYEEYAGLVASLDENIKAKVVVGNDCEINALGKVINIEPYDNVLSLDDNLKNYLIYYNCVELFSKPGVWGSADKNQDGKIQQSETSDVKSIDLSRGRDNMPNYGQPQITYTIPQDIGRGFDFKNYDPTKQYSQNEIQDLVYRGDIKFYDNLYIQPIQLIADFSGINSFVNLESLSICFAKPNAFHLKNLENLKSFKNVTYSNSLPIQGKTFVFSSPINYSVFVFNQQQYFSSEYQYNSGVINELTFTNCPNIEVINFKEINSSNQNGGYINSSYEQIKTLDVSELKLLKELDCSESLISNLVLPKNSALEKLNCSKAQLQSLDLQQNTKLTNVDCRSNLLKMIDVSLNKNLAELYISKNQITKIDVSKNTALSRLECSGNKITNLDVSNNPILSYDSSDFSNNSLIQLNIKNGNEGSNYVPNFRNNPTLKYICADESKLKAVQAKIKEYNYTNVSVNTYCTFTPGGEFYTIKGKNQDCKDNTTTIPNLKYSITDGVTTGTIVSNEKGEYNVPVQKGKHTITPTLENPDYYTVTPANIIVDFATATSPSINDFCITPKTTKNDLEVLTEPSGTPARPGFDAKYKITYKNKGTTTQSGTVDLQFQKEVLDYITSTSPNISKSLNRLMFEYKDLKPFEKREIEVTFNVNSPMETPAVNGGDVIVYTTTITSNQTDETPNDNTHTLRQTIVNSFDPNDKTCLEGNEIRPEMIGQYIHYKIRFENTGTFPAENIVVVDEIDATKFDISTIVPIDGSHAYETKITGNKVEFIFQKINLPFDDANNDGYITFKIKTLSTLKLNDSFSNQASIYFDFNFPIVTNNETTTITESHLNTSEFNFNDQLNLYPNPAKDRLTIEPKNGTTIQSVTIYNLQGQLVLSIPQVSQTSFDVSNLQKGVYVVTVNTDKGATTTKLVKE